MGIYLVMKNNLKRTFISKHIYCLILLLPVIVSMIATIMNEISDKTIRVGILTKEEAIYQQCQNQLNQYDNIQCKRADASTMHTDLIMNKFQYIIDYSDGVDTKVTINEIVTLAHNHSNQTANQLLSTERMVAMLLPVYMIIAAIYATKLIKDKKDGTYQRFIYAGNNAKQYTMGYLFSTGLIIFIQVFIAVLLLTLLNHQFALSMISAVTLIIAITLFTTLFGVIIALLNKKDMNANICASSIAVICSLLGGTFVSIADMPFMLQVLSVFNPIRWIIALI